jgi:hypothetical protein
VKNQKSVYDDIIKGYTEIELEHYGKSFYKHITIEDSASIEDTSNAYRKKAEDIGLPSEKEQLITLNEQEIWTDEEEQKLQELKTLLSALKSTRRKLYLQKQIVPVEKQIEETQEEHDGLMGEKEESVGLTVEKYSSKKASEYYLRTVLFKDRECKNHLISKGEFEELDELALNSLYLSYIAISKMFDDRTVKCIALAPFFLSIFYICDDNPMTLFGKAVIKLTYNQTNLFTYARYYKHLITEAKVKPPEELYADPDKLVDWLESAREGQKVAEKAMVEEGKAGGMSIVGATKEDLKKMGLNSPVGGINLSKEAAKKGGTLDMEDFIRLHG